MPQGIKKILTITIYYVQQIRCMNNNPAKHTRKITFKIHYFNIGQYSLFLYYSQGHLVNIKERFMVGYIRLFDDHKMYYREIYSTDHLNTAVEWNHQFFFTLLEQFGKFQIKKREDQQDQSLQFTIRGDIEQGKGLKLLEATLEPDFGTDIQKQFWKEFSSYNESKNQEIQQYEVLSKENAVNEEKRLESIKTYCENAERQKKMLLGRLSAILTQKINKLKQYEQDYNIQLLQEKFQRVREDQEQRIMSTYQQDIVFGASLFQPSQDFR